MRYEYEDWMEVEVIVDNIRVGCKGLFVGWEESGWDCYPPDGEDKMVDFYIDYAEDIETDEEVELTEEQKEKARELAENSDDWWR